MRKFLNLLGAAALVMLLAVGLAPSAQAAAEDSPGQICKVVKPELEFELGLFLGHPVSISNGDCVTFITAMLHENGAFKPGICKLLVNAELIPESEYGNCVSTLAQGGDIPVGPTYWSVVVFAVLLAGWGFLQLARRRNESLCTT